MNKKVVYIWELSGFIFIVTAGTLLHFCFDFFNQSRLIAPFCPVNESVWEHLKLAFWPSLVFAFIEFYYLEKSYVNFWTAKALSLYVSPLIIVALYYSYTGLLGRNYLFLDISIFVIAVLAAQLISYRTIMSPYDYSSAQKASILAIALLAILFMVFTFFQPRLDIFKDPKNGSFGIQKK